MFSDFGFYLLRQPHWSINQLLQLQQSLTSESLADQLKIWYENPLAQQALSLASPALYERFQVWMTGAMLPEGDKFLLSLYKYTIRMSTRCTPYGLFAGGSLGKMGPTTKLQGIKPDQIRTHTRLDVEYLFALKDWLIQQPVLQNQLLLYPCSSLYTVGESYRYVEQIRANQQRQYFISAVEKNDFLEMIFSQARNGASLSELQSSLIEQGIEAHEAADYLDELVSNHLLVFEIEPTLTGTDYLQKLIARLQELKNTGLLVNTLEQLHSLLNSGHDLRLTYEATRQWLTQHEQSISKPDVIQVDSFHDLPDNQISTSVIKKIAQQLSRLTVLNRTEKNADLESFKRRFYNRYEDEEVPLAIALDYEIGVGYGQHSPMGMGYAPMVDDLSLPTMAGDSDYSRPTWWQDFLLKKFSQCLSNQQREIRLTDQDLSWMGQHQTPAPRTAYGFYALGNLLASSSQVMDSGNFEFNLLACSGPSAVNLLSRFCEGHTQLAQEVQTCVSQEEAFHGEVIFAEIVYCPDSRAGNILTRPSLHAYEIPYMGQSSVESEYQIPIEDLWVSLLRQEIILRSKRLNKRIIPRLSNAHNYRDSLPLYRFLCDLQSQDSPFLLRWDWGLLSKQSFLPRISYENIIISRASWTLTKEDCPSQESLLSILSEKGLPDLFVIARADHELLINQKNTPSLQLLWQELRKHDSLKLVEFVVKPDQCPLESEGLRFTHEVLIPFYNTKAVPIPGLLQKRDEVPQRRFSIGSEWLYLKVYTGEKSSDLILTHTLYPVIRQLLKNQIISQFFFVRYKDPDPHLRLRFLGNPHLEFYHHVIRVIEQVLRPLVQSGVVHRIQTDTYQRELERYGMQHIELCETFFHYDSLTTLDFLEQSELAASETLRFVFTARQIDQVLRYSDFSLSERYQLMNHLREHFFQEFSGDPTLRKQLNDKFRLYRPLLEQGLTLNDDDIHPGLREVLHRLKINITDFSQRWNVLISCIHMMINRLFSTKQRAYELIIYTCLTKYYDSAQAKEKMLFGK